MWAFQGCSVCRQVVFVRQSCKKLTQLLDHTPLNCINLITLVQGTGKLEHIESADWTAETIPSWRHSIWVGVYNPWPVIAKLNPVLWYKTVREIVTLERMHRAFDSGLMQYGMMKAVKKAA